MTQATPACARPSKKHPEGRTGTSAGYAAHRVAGEESCRPCLDANTAAQKIRRVRNGHDEKQRRRYAENREFHSYRSIRAKYKLTEEQYKALLEAQGGGCAVCGTDKPGGRGVLLNVDHDHACCPGNKSCGKCVRGLLCALCNIGLGSFQDNADRLIAAATYLTSRTGVGNAKKHASGDARTRRAPGLVPHQERPRRGRISGSGDQYLW